MTTTDKIVNQSAERSGSRLGSLLQEFGDQTTCHGVDRILAFNARNNILKWKNVMWTGFLLLSMGMATLNLLEIFDDYSSHPVSTDVDIEFRSDIHFPMVTICNLNAVVSDKLSREWNTWVQRLEVPEFDRTGNNQPGAKEDWMISLIQNVLRGFNASEREATGHLLSEMLLSCSYGTTLQDMESQLGHMTLNISTLPYLGQTRSLQDMQMKCSADDFKYVSNPVYGNCYSVDSEKVARRKQYSSGQRVKAGPRQGLKLVLDVQQSQYMLFTEAVGIKVLIHEKDEVPFPDKAGLVAPPGFITNIGLSRFDIHRAKKPYGYCVAADGEDSAKLNLFASQGYSYSDVACMATCFQLHILRRCSCCDPSYPCDDSILDVQSEKNKGSMNFTDIHFCSSDSPEEFQCLSDMYNKGKATKPRCSINDCPPACETTMYEQSYSLAVWPPKDKARSMYETIGGNRRFGVQTEDAARIASVRENVMALNVYFEHLSAVTIRSEPTYNWNRLLSDVGGQLGLWLGCSLLTAVEIAEFVLDAGIYLATSLVNSVSRLLCRLGTKKRQGIQ